MKEAGEGEEPAFRWLRRDSQSPKVLIGAKINQSFLKIYRWARAGWQSGHAAACKAVYAGSIPTPASKTINNFGVAARTLGGRGKGAKKLKIHDLGPHALRHEATSIFFEKGLSATEAASMTGHKSLNTLKRYTHPNVTELSKKLG